MKGKCGCDARMQSSTKPGQIYLQNKRIELRHAIETLKYLQVNNKLRLPSSSKLQNLSPKNLKALLHTTG